MSLDENSLSTQLVQVEKNVIDAVVERQYAQHPELEIRYGPQGRIRCREDAAYHLSYLRQALILNSPALFADYVDWVKVVLAQRNIPVADLALNLDNLRQALQENLPETWHTQVTKYVSAGIERLQKEVEPPLSFVESSGELAVLARQYLNALLRLERHTASQLILDALEAGHTVKDLYLSVFQPVQYEIGRLWQLNQISVAQEHYCTATTQLIMSQLYPHIFTGEGDKGMMVAACVGNELHEIGVRMVADFFEMDGWNTMYLGANVPQRDLLGALRSQQATLLCLAVTMTYHLQQAQAIIQAVRSQPELSNVKILVGGYPFKLEPALWQTLGADGFGEDALSAVNSANQLFGY